MLDIHERSVHRNCCHWIFKCDHAFKSLKEIHSNKFQRTLISSREFYNFSQIPPFLQCCRYILHPTHNVDAAIYNLSPTEDCRLLLSAVKWTSLSFIPSGGLDIFCCKMQGIDLSNYVFSHPLSITRVELWCRCSWSHQKTGKYAS